MNRNPLPELARTLRTLGDYGNRLDPAHATPEQLAIVQQALDHARRLLATAQTPASGCARHPGGPADPTRSGACLLCRTRLRPVPGAAPASVEDVARDLAELGPQEATRRHGGRAVARALATVGRGRHKYSPNQLPSSEPDDHLSPPGTPRN